MSIILKPAACHAKPANPVPLTPFLFRFFSFRNGAAVLSGRTEHAVPPVGNEIAEGTAAAVIITRTGIRTRTAGSLALIS